jgi:hypothetical protein
LGEEQGRLVGYLHSGGAAVIDTKKSSKLTSKAVVFRESSGHNRPCAITSPTCFPSRVSRSSR